MTTTMKKCLKCGAFIEDGAVFCGNCGTVVSKETSCPQCGHPVRPEETYCGSCGAYLAKKTGPQSRPEAQRKSRKNKQGSKNTGLLICAVILGAAVLVSGAMLAGWMIYQKSQGDSEPFPTQAATASPLPSASAVPSDQPAVSPSAQPTVEPAAALATPVPPAVQSNSAVQPAGGYYVFPSDQQYLTDTYLNARSREEIRLILNEMYARHGYIFTSEANRQYFSAQPWYTPRYQTQEEAEAFFNSIERSNKEKIAAYEKARGWR